MKKFRKIMAILVAALMIAATMVPAWATPGEGRWNDSTTGTITIKNAVKGETYQLYKVFDLVSYADVNETTDSTATNNHSTDAYFYALNKDSGWVDFFRTGKAGFDYIDLGTDLITFDSATAPATLAGQYYAVKGYKLNSPNSGDGFTESTGSYATDFDETDGHVTYYAQSAQEFARAAVEWIATAKADASITDISVYDTKTPTANGDITISPVELGYYLLVSSEGKLLALDTTNKTATVIEKNVAPVINKYVQEDYDTSADIAAADKGDGLTNYKEKNDADIGQTVYYKSVINVKKGDKGYVLHDQMGAGLTFDATSVKVYLVRDDLLSTFDASLPTLPAGIYKLTASDASAAATEEITIVGGTKFTQNQMYIMTPSVPHTSNEGYTTVNAARISGTHTFDIAFQDAFLDEVDKNITGATNATNWSLVVLYEAVLNKNAGVGVAAATTDSKNMNKTTVTFGDKQETELDSTTTYTYEIDILKFSQKPSNPTNLKGAQFQIKRKGSSSALQFVVDGTKYRYDARVDATTHTFNTIPTGESDVVDTVKTASEDDFDDAGSATVTVVNTLKTDANGKIVVEGLDAGEYEVTETLAPKGYIKLASSFDLYIASAADGDAATSGGGIAVGTGKAAQGDVLIVDGTEYKTTKDALAIDSDKKTVKVENFTSAELPSTGGMGTTVLYIVGGMLVILAGAYLFFSRKRTA